MCLSKRICQTVSEKHLCKKCNCSVSGVRVSNLLTKDRVPKQKQKSIVSMFTKLSEKKPNTQLQPEPFLPVCDDGETTKQGESQAKAEGIVCKDSVEVIEPSTEYLCPVCEENIRCQNLDDFNEHLDNCVIISPKCKTELNCELKEDKQTKDEPVTTHTPVIDSLGPPDGSNNKLHQEESPYTSHELHEEIPSTSHMSNRTSLPKEDSVGSRSAENSQTSIACPVCNREFDGLQNLNRHLDQCLSKGAIKRCQQESR